MLLHVASEWPLGVLINTHQYVGRHAVRSGSIEPICFQSEADDTEELSRSQVIAFQFDVRSSDLHIGQFRQHHLLKWYERMTRRQAACVSFSCCRGRGELPSIRCDAECGHLEIGRASCRERV